MATCPSCGGILGRDCFNPVDCAQISHNNDQYLSDRLDNAITDIINMQNQFEKLTNILISKGIDLSELYKEEDNLPF